MIEKGTRGRRRERDERRLKLAELMLVLLSESREEGGHVRVLETSWGDSVGGVGVGVGWGDG